MSGATTGKFGIYKDSQKTYQNQRVGNLKLHNDKLIDKRYIYYLLYSLRQRIEKDAYGGAQPNISGKKIEAIEFKLAPLPEQRAIVAKIEQLFSELDNGIANLKAAKDKLEIYRQAVLKKAFEGELTKEWREQQTNLLTADEMLEQIKEERLKHYENQLTEWEEAAAKWELNGRQGKKPSKPKKVIKYPKCEGEQTIFGLARLGEITFQISQKFMPEEAPELPFIGMDCIDKNGLEPTFTYKFKELTSAGNWFKSGHILYGRLRPYLNKLFLSDYEGIASGEFIILEAIESINRKYLLYYLHQQEFVNWSNVQSSGDKPRVKFDQIALREIPIPPINEQSQIVQEIESRLSVCDNILANIEEGLEKSEALRQSILKQAFEGKLLSEEELEACKNEADWEPAEKLLERVKNEKLAEA